MVHSQRRYHIGAITKIVIGLFIALIVYNFVNPSEDPAIGIGFLLLSSLLVSRGTSFYIFMGLNTFIAKSHHDIFSESYKMSLLFGLCILLNATLIFLGSRSKGLGLGLLIGFVVLHVILFNQTKKEYDR